MNGKYGGMKMECARCEYYKAKNCRHQCMLLPDGKTCGDYIHIERCELMFHGNSANKSCGFEPIRFKAQECMPEGLI